MQSVQPLTVQQLHALVDSVTTAGSEDQAKQALAPILACVTSRSALSCSFRHGSGTPSARVNRSHAAGDAGCDYNQVLEAFTRLCNREANQWWSSAVENLSGAVLKLFEFAHRCHSRATSEAASPAAGDATENGPAENVVSPDSLKLDVEMEESGVEDEQPSPRVWALVAVAAILPALVDALPRAQDGVCIIPHQHPMERQEASEDSIYLAGSGRLAFRTNKVCDNCQTRIVDRFFFHCSQNCDIDFCEECQKKLQEVLDLFFRGAQGQLKAYEQLHRVVAIMDKIAEYLLHLGADERLDIGRELAFGWPTAMFALLVKAVIDVVNAKVVHVQDVKDISSDAKFWYAVGLLQFLYSCNLLPCNEKRLDEQAVRQPKIDIENFILEGINKCEPISEWQRWREHPSAQVPDVLRTAAFQLSDDFCSFLTHNNLVPVSFRRVCLLCDVWEQIQQQMTRVVPLHIEVRRDPLCMLEDILEAFDGLSDDELRRPLHVTFEAEDGAGPGVTKEFFQVALRCFLDPSRPGLFEYHTEQRTYWFSPSSDNPDAFRAVGILLGQAILNNVLVPNIFPRVLYEKLLLDLNSPYARPLDIQGVAMVDRDTAQSLQRVVDYTGDDIGEVFGDMGWEQTNRLPQGAELVLATRKTFVDAYVDWYFSDRVAAQFRPLSEGFRAILGRSMLLRSMVDAVQLEKIVCGGGIPVDIPSIQRGSSVEGWTEEEEKSYLPWFWETVESFTQGEKIQFVVFVTASDRVPLRGWQDLALTVQKNGVGDDRLPTAYTCFSQLLLPRYTSKQKLRWNLLSAIANSEGFGLR